MSKKKLLAENLFDYSKTIAKPLLESVEYPWEALPKIKDFIIELGKTLDPEVYEQRGENIWVAKSATVFPSAYLGGTADYLRGRRDSPLRFYQRKRNRGQRRGCRQFNRAEKFNPF